MRNSSGNIVSNQSISLKLSVLDTGGLQTPIYSEIFYVNTNQFGLISLKMGTGSPFIGLFSSIDWANGPYAVKTEVDLSGGLNFQSLGVSQLVSVPYALYSERAGMASADKILIPGNYGEILYFDGQDWASTNVVFIDSNNVGIGTLSPQYDLDVQGTVKADSLYLPNGAFNSFVLTCDPNGYAFWDSPGIKILQDAYD